MDIDYITSTLSKLTIPYSPSMSIEELYDALGLDDAMTVTQYDPQSIRHKRMLKVGLSLLKDSLPDLNAALYSVYLSAYTTSQSDRYIRYAIEMIAYEDTNTVKDIEEIIDVMDEAVKYLMLAQYYNDVCEDVNVIAYYLRMLDQTPCGVP